MKDYVNYGNFCRYSQSPYVYDYYDNFFQKNNHREPSPTIRKTQKLLIIGKTDKIMNFYIGKTDKIMNFYIGKTDKIMYFCVGAHEKNAKAFAKR